MAFVRNRFFSCILSRQTRSFCDAKVITPYLSRGDVYQLFSEIGSYREVKEYCKKFSATENFAVIKVGGAVLMNDRDELVQKLGFLQKVGLTPVVVHGAGPQVNERLERDKVKFDYVDGQRITTPEILTMVRSVVFEQNSHLVSALESMGTRARPLLTGVFTAEKLTEPDLGLVGRIVGVNKDLVVSAARDGCIPIISCLASTAQGNALNVNADFAALELAKSLKPMKVVWISGKGGLADENGDIMDMIDLSHDFDRLIGESWFKHGDKLKLKLIKDLLSSLPSSSSVSITNAQMLSRELFTHRGAGTLICHQEPIKVFKALDDVDTERIKDLLEDAFQARVDKNYFKNLQANKDSVQAIYVSENYNACAIITKDEELGVSILDKFAVRRANQSDGLGARIFKSVKENHDKCFWRARKINDGRRFHDSPINDWYFKTSTFSYHVPDSPWVIFGYGNTTFEEHSKIVTSLAAKVPTIIHKGEEVKTSMSDPIYQVQEKLRIGLIGARGYTGDALAEIIDKHDRFQLSVVSSRKFEGKKACDVMHTRSTVTVTNLTTEHVADKSSQVDAWVLAMPNGLAAGFAKNIPADVPVIDLSADFRWDPVDIQDPEWNSYWQYGLPERAGNRARLAKAKRIANPGCYASAMQLGILPLAEELKAANPRVKIINSPHCFGISGYSGAGTTPSDKNDPEVIHDNIVPYALVNHGHEREVSHQFSTHLSDGIFFTPHVGQFFRGINMTISMDFDPSVRIPSTKELFELYSAYYENEQLVEVQEKVPLCKSVVGRHTCIIGGFQVNPERNKIVVVAVLDNLLKGAASVCMQNLNLMFGFPEAHGLMPKGTEIPDKPTQYNGHLHINGNGNHARPEPYRSVEWPFYLHPVTTQMELSLKV